MKKCAARFIAPLTLFEWGAILTYFYFSHRIAAFLRPGFRPLVLTTGIVLLLIALCLLFFPDADELDTCDDPRCGHLYGRMTAGRLLGFLVLLLPIAVAAHVSPDTFDRVVIENRGAAETANDAVLSNAQPARPVYVGVNDSSTPSLPAPRNAFNYSASVDVPETSDFPLGGRNAARPTPLNERPGAVTQFGDINDILAMSASQLNQDSFRPGEDPVVQAEVVDLLIAARKPALMKAFEGRTVEMTGQCLRGGKGSFKLLRLLMICCAADAQPLAVRVQSRETVPDMAWAKVTGKVSFATRGGRFVPVVTAEKVVRVGQPEEPYIY